jgi:hypothetical protein
LSFLDRDDVRSRVYALLFQAHVDLCPCTKHVHGRTCSETAATPMNGATTICNVFPVHGRIIVPVTEAVAAVPKATTGGELSGIFDPIFDTSVEDVGDGSGVCYFDRELTTYLSENSTREDAKLSAVQWWHKNRTRFPGVARLARRYLAIPASEAPSERVFSALNLTHTPQRSRMALDLSAMLAFLKGNHPLMEYIRAQRKARGESDDISSDTGSGSDGDE